MSTNDHRNPDGTYNAVNVLSDITGLPREEVASIAEQVKANHERLNGCDYHEFRAMSASEAGLRASRSQRYRCIHCQGEVDSTAYRWHQIGRESVEPKAL